MLVFHYSHTTATEGTSSTDNKRNKMQMLTQAESRKIICIGKYLQRLYNQKKIQQKHFQMV